MKKILLLISLAVLQLVAFAQTNNSSFDSTLAKSLGADEYGMKSYVLAILKTGPFTTTDKLVLDSLFRGHLDNINRFAELGKLTLAGPLGKNEKQYRGIFILNVKTVEEAEELTLTDPAVKAGIFEIELYPWDGSAALPVYLETHKKIEKKSP